jgi:hypothetical protein
LQYEENKNATRIYATYSATSRKTLYFERPSVQLVGIGFTVRFTIGVSLSTLKELVCHIVGFILFGLY